MLLNVQKSTLAVTLYSESQLLEEFLCETRLLTDFFQFRGLSSVLFSSPESKENPQKPILGGEKENVDC